MTLEAVVYPLPIRLRDLRAALPHVPAIPEGADVELQQDGTLVVSTDIRAWRMPTRLTDCEVAQLLTTINAVESATLPPRS